MKAVCYTPISGNLPANLQFPLYHPPRACRLSAPLYDNFQRRVRIEPYPKAENIGWFARLKTFLLKHLHPQMQEKLLTVS